jgi:hypothetical protein
MATVEKPILTLCLTPVCTTLNSPDGDIKEYAANIAESIYSQVDDEDDTSYCRSTGGS